MRLFQVGVYFDMYSARHLNSRILSDKILIPFLYCNFCSPYFRTDKFYRVFPWLLNLSVHFCGNPKMVEQISLEIEQNWEKSGFWCRLVMKNQFMGILGVELGKKYWLKAVLPLHHLLRSVRGRFRQDIKSTTSTLIFNSVVFLSLGDVHCTILHY